MTQDEIIKLAREAGSYLEPVTQEDIKALERFAALVAERERDALLGPLKEAGLFLHHAWCDIQMNEYSFEKLNKTMEVVDAALRARNNT